MNVPRHINARACYSSHAFQQVSISVSLCSMQHQLKYVIVGGSWWRQVHFNWFPARRFEQFYWSGSTFLMFLGLRQPDCSRAGRLDGSVMRKLHSTTCPSQLLFYSKLRSTTLQETGSSYEGLTCFWPLCRQGLSRYQVVSASLRSTKTKMASTAGGRYCQASSSAVAKTFQFVQDVYWYGLTLRENMLGS